MKARSRFRGLENAEQLGELGEERESGKRKMTKWGERRKRNGGFFELFTKIEAPH